MKNNYSVEQMLIAVQPENRMINTAFVTKTMGRIRVSRMEKVLDTAASPPGGVSHRPFSARLLALPKFALALLIVLSFLLVSGSAYAAYRLWIKPEVTVQSVGQNQYNRTEITAALMNCDTLGDTITTEIKRGTKLDASETEAVLQAKCEKTALQDWAGNEYPAVLDTMTMVRVYELAAIHDDQVRIKDPKYGDTRSITLTKETLVISDGIPVAAHTLRPGTAIGFVEYLEYKKGGSGHPIRRTPKAIVQLSLPAQYYIDKKQNSLSTRTSCVNMTRETCVESASIDIFPRNEGDAIQHAVIDGEIRILQGILVSQAGETFVLRGTSGTEYSFTAPYDAINTFNTKYSQDYQNQKIDPGDLLQVRYVIPLGSPESAVQANQIMHIDLMIDITDKNAPFKKY